MDEKLRQHYLAKNYGPYADADGELPTCFLTNNDITGGNSGSAVLNARGELIGLAFDGNIESLSSDLRYNPQLQRCINADIRYILFVIDTYGGSTLSPQRDGNSPLNPSLHDASRSFCHPIARSPRSRRGERALRCPHRRRHPP